MALLACHTLRHSFNAAEHARLKQRQACLDLFVQPGPAVQAASTRTQSTPSRHALQGHASSRANASTALERSSLPASTSMPTHVEHMQEVIAANLPVFFFHPREQYFPCTVDWFLHRCQLALIRRGWRRQLLALLAKQGSVTGETLQVWFWNIVDLHLLGEQGVEPSECDLDFELLPCWPRSGEPVIHVLAQDHAAFRDVVCVQEAQQAFDRRPVRERRRQFMLLQLDPAARAGQPCDVNQIPVYAHVKEVVSPKGVRDALEINYMKFLAYNGSYKPFGIIPAGDLGAHDADWEHVTVRLTADAEKLLGVYYSAHRHRDGVWRSADEVPLTSSGRIRAHIALDGHGSYPQAGFIPRVFFAFNDITSDQGVVWQPQQVVVVTPPGLLPSVSTRGCQLNGSMLPAQRDSHTITDGQPPATAGVQLRNSEHLTELQQQAGGGITAEREEAYRPVAVMQPSHWLAFEGRWGSSVEAPACQEWFYRAENPVTRTWLRQVLFPLAPGVESIWQPVQEQVEEAVEDIQRALDELQGTIDVNIDSFREKLDTNIDTLRGSMRDSSTDMKQRYTAAVEALTRARESGIEGQDQGGEDVMRRLKEAIEALKTSKRNGDSNAEKDKQR